MTDYPHDTLRLKAMQLRNAERVLGGVERQRAALEADGLPDVAWAALDSMIASLMPVRARLKKELVVVMKGSRLAEWVGSTHGLGPGLYFVLGLMPPIDEENLTSPAKVWRYLGLDVVHSADEEPETDEDGNFLPGQGEARRRRRGKVAGFSPYLRAQAIYRIADPIVKVGGPYREVYDRRKARTKETWPDATDGHRHADALRVTAKAVLRDAWRVMHGKAPRVKATVVSAPESDPPEPSGQRTNGAAVRRKARSTSARGRSSTLPDPTPAGAPEEVSSGSAR